MAKTTGISQSAIARTWPAIERQPWRSESFKLCSPTSCTRINDRRFDADRHDLRLWASEITDSSFTKANLSEAAVGTWHEGRRNVWRRVDFSGSDFRIGVSFDAVYEDCDFSGVSRRVYSFDGGLAIPLDLPGAHHLVEEIKVYMPTFERSAQAHGLSARAMWLEAAVMYITRTTGPVPRQLRDLVFTDLSSSRAMKEALGAGLVGAWGSLNPGESAIVNNTVAGQQVVQGDTSLGTEGDQVPSRDVVVGRSTVGKIHADIEAYERDPETAGMFENYDPYKGSKNIGQFLKETRKLTPVAGTTPSTADSKGRPIPMRRCRAKCSTASEEIVASTFRRRARPSRTGRCPRMR